MHTARQLDASLFEILIEGVPATREVLRPDWQPYDRFGIVVDESFGAVGASLLMQLAVMAFYDSRPSRRDTVIYPEIYLFHVGGRHGDHSHYDVFPPRKEVLDDDDDPARILEFINDRAITRLAVRDGPVERVTHHWKEPGAALDRIASAFAYSPNRPCGRP